MRAVFFIAQKSVDGRKVGIKEVAAGIDSPEPFIAKILQDLSKRGLIQSTKGPNGGFYAEAAERRLAGVPPYGPMAGIILSSTDVAQVFDFGGELARRDGPLQRIGAQVWGPAPAPIARVRGRHRVRLLVKAEKSAPLQAALAEWVAQFKLPNNLRLSIDIDPQSFY